MRTIIAAALVAATIALPRPLAGQARGAINRSRAAAMAPLNRLTGTWIAEGRIRWGPGQTWVQLAAEPVRIDTLLRGRFLRMVVRAAQGSASLETHFIWSYDAIQSRYRLAVLDDQVGLLDSFAGSATLPVTVDNLTANTYYPAPTANGLEKTLARVTLDIPDSTRFLMTQQNTADSGKTWTPFFEVVARRAP